MRPATQLSLLAAVALAGCAEVLGLDAYEDLGAAATGAGAAGAGPGGGGVGGVGGVGGTGGAGGSAPVRCGGLGVLNDDDFTDDIIAPEWLVDAPGAGSALESGGFTVVALDPSVASTERAFLIGTHSHDLREDSITVEVDSVPNEPLMFTELRLRQTTYAGNLISFQVSEGMLTVSSSLGTHAGPIAYDPSAHRFWRLRAEGDSVMAETAPTANGTPTVHATVALDPLFAYPRYVVPQFGLRTEAPVTTRQEARFASVTAGPPSGQPWCKSDTLTDAFADGSELPAWGDARLNDCTASEAGGQVELTMTGVNGSPPCYYRSSAAYDLTDSSYTLRVAVGAPAPDSVETTIYVDDENWISAQYRSDDSFRVEVSVAGSVSNPVLRNGVGGMALFRWREDAGEVVLEISVDGQSWSDGYSAAPSPIALDRVELQFGIIGPLDTNAVFSELNAGGAG